MTAILHTSTQFACVIASGADWREVGRKLLESIESIRTENDGMTVGFLYATEDMNADYASLLALVKNITRIPHWFGATGSGICGNGKSITGMPGAVAMIAKLPEDAFHPFTLPSDFTGILPGPMRQWIDTHPSSVAFTHGLLCAPAARALDICREKEGLYMVGGFASGRNGGMHASSGTVVEADPISGILIDDHIRVMLASSQGCVTVGPVHEITKCRDNVISHINGRTALDVLHECVDTLDLPHSDTIQRKGHIHAAFPITGTDIGSLRVRNITQVDEQKGTMSIAHSFARGDAIQFIYRDRFTAMDDLTVTLKNLHTRARRDVGEANLKPKALLYFGCAARMPESNDTDEAALIKTVFGDIPMAGFYTAAEVCNGHVYGYTGVAVLIL